MLNPCNTLVYNFILYRLDLFIGAIRNMSLTKNFVGRKYLWLNLGCWLVWYGAAMLILLYLIVWYKCRMISFEKIKQYKFLNGHITYQSHMFLSKFKSSTYACLWPIEFCQIVVTLGRIFSCSHDRDHVHPHIHANSYTRSYAKHAIHPTKKLNK
jgi:hypothetical protein